MAQNNVNEVPSPFAASQVSPAFSQASTTAAPVRRPSTPTAPETLSWPQQPLVPGFDTEADNVRSRSATRHTRGRSHSLSPTRLQVEAGLPVPHGQFAEPVKQVRLTMCSILPHSLKQIHSHYCISRFSYLIEALLYTFMR